MHHAPLQRRQSSRTSHRIRCTMNHASFQHAFLCCTRTLSWNGQHLAVHNNPQVVCRGVLRHIGVGVRVHRLSCCTTVVGGTFAHAVWSGLRLPRGNSTRLLLLIVSGTPFLINSPITLPYYRFNTPIAYISSHIRHAQSLYPKSFQTGQGQRVCGRGCVLGARTRMRRRVHHLCMTMMYRSA